MSHGWDIHLAAWGRVQRESNFQKVDCDTGMRDSSSGILECLVEEVMKRRFWLVLILPLAFAFCSPAEPVAGEEVAGSEQPAERQPPLPEGLFNSYVASQEALALDSYEDARAALEQLAADSSGELQTLAQAAAAAEDIEGIRAAFVSLSDEIAEATLPEGYSLAFCPMANNLQGANWVQKGQDIHNPYFGASMLTCGEIVRQ